MQNYLRLVDKQHNLRLTELASQITVCCRQQEDSEWYRII